MRVTLHLMHPEGYPITVTLDPSEAATIVSQLEQLTPTMETLLRGLKSQGYRPPTGAWPTGPDGAPLCLKHGGLPMVKREKQGDTWYSHRVVTAQGEERYCRGYATAKPDDGYHC
jgi:hypothetical protein